MLKKLNNSLVFWGLLPYLLGIFTSTDAMALEQWRCTVEDFRGFGNHDDTFIEANLRKRFLLTVTASEVLVKMTSKDFKDHESRYEIVGQNALDLHAVEKNIVLLSTLVMPKTPRLDNGFFNVTVTVQSDFYVNSWLLRCVE